MVKGLQRSMSRGNELRQEIVKRVIAVRVGLLTADGATGVGFGSLVIGDFPAGNILLLGAIAYMQFSGPTSGDLVDTWEGDYGIGTTPASDATITAGDVDMVPSTALAAAVAEISPRTRGVNATGALTGQIFDNTDDSLELNLNLLIDDVDIAADGIVMTVNGELHLAYIAMGDD